MCGRYHFGILPGKKGRQIRERAERLNLVYKEGEIFPDDKVLCIIPVEAKIDLSVMKWGIKNKNLQINARSESLADRPSYREMRNRRCAVICNGFYEWDKDKNKYYVSTDEEYIYLACIFNDKNELLIITEAADEEFAKVHDRKPLIMNQEEMLKYVHNEDMIFSNKKLSFRREDNEIKLF
ncbi:MAG: SOS response-associated peptidase family protein [Oscillospiraceae bacterium]|nr:SOS response-associated peptidase family protein [Oscillospiraceae bacterium]MBQ6493965.1 SOS response-associated peptidase family protein [Erysipelotrichaceae bacterium]